MKVLLSNRGNPDLRQDPDRPLPGTPDDAWVQIRNGAQARKVCQRYIREHDLGGGNWTGGLVMSDDGSAELARISYNGTFPPRFGAPK